MTAAAVLPMSPRPDLSELFERSPDESEREIRRIAEACRAHPGYWQHPTLGERSDRFLKVPRAAAGLPPEVVASYLAVVNVRPDRWSPTKVARITGQDVRTERRHLKVLREHPAMFNRVKAPYIRVPRLFEGGIPWLEDAATMLALYGLVDGRAFKDYFVIRKRSRGDVVAALQSLTGWSRATCYRRFDQALTSGWMSPVPQGWSTGAQYASLMPPASAVAAPILPRLDMVPGTWIRPGLWYAADPTGSRWPCDTPERVSLVSSLSAPPGHG